MADKCSKCGRRFPSIKLAGHVKQCRGTKRIVTQADRPAKPVNYTGSVCLNTAQLETDRIAEYYERLWKQGDDDMDAILRQRGIKPGAPRCPKP